VTTPSPSSAAQTRARPRRASLLSYLGAIAACAATTGIATLLLLYFDLANIVMMFLLTVVLVAVWLGRGPAILAAVLSVALFDFFFVPPRFSFTVHDVQYLLTFAVMLVVALVFGELTARLSEQAQIASAREKRTHALYDLARELSGASTLSDASNILRRFLTHLVGAEGVIYVARPYGRLQVAGDVPAANLAAFDQVIVELAQAQGEYIRLDTNGYFPLTASGRVHGVMAVRFREHLLALEEHLELLTAVASLIAIVVERLAAGEATGPITEPSREPPK
jgi:two-component system sensor histidine kinase KdpD